MNSRYELKQQDNKFLSYCFSSYLEFTRCYFSEYVFSNTWLRLVFSTPHGIWKSEEVLLVFEQLLEICTCGLAHYRIFTTKWRVHYLYYWGCLTNTYPYIFVLLRLGFDLHRTRLLKKSKGRLLKKY